MNKVNEEEENMVLTKKEKKNNSAMQWLSGLANINFITMFATGMIDQIL